MSATDVATTADLPACAIPPGTEARLTATIEVLASGCAGEQISFDDLTSTLGDKCFAGLLFLLAAPNMLPVPPGTDMLLSIPLMFISAQLLLGMRRPWLPAWVLRREVSTAAFAKLAERLSPLTRRTEMLLRRRIDPLTGLIGRRLIGLISLALAIMIALPIPLGNAVPAAAIALLALGMLARDGMAVLAGLAATIASAVIAAGFGYAAVEAIRWLGRQLSG